MAETFYKSRHTGAYIDDQIEQVGKNTASIAGLADQAEKLNSEKADKSQIPVSISDLVHDAALVYVGDKAPEAPEYTVWVYLSNDLKKSKIYSKAKDGSWIDTSPETYEIFKVGFQIEELESGDTSVSCAEEIRDIRYAMDNGLLPIGYELSTHKTFLLQNFSPVYVLFSCMSKDEDGQSITENIEYTENQGWVYSATANLCPDWNQNDTSKADYVKNRPFYKEEVIVDVINAEDIGISQSDKELALNIYRHVSFSIQNNMEYDVELVSSSDNIQVHGITPTYDEIIRMWTLDCGDFGIYDYEGYLATSDNIFFQQLNIYAKDIIYHPIPKEYLPEGIEGTQEIYVGSGDMPEGYVLQIDPEGDDVTDIDTLEERITQNETDIKELQEGGGSGEQEIVYIHVRLNYGNLKADKTYDEIVAVSQSGKTLIVDYENNIYMPVRIRSGNTLVFSRSMLGDIFTLTGLSDNTWEYTNYSLAQTQYVDEKTTPFIVTITDLEGKSFASSDKKVGEIYTAYQEGREIIGVHGAYILRLICATDTECLFTTVELNGKHTIYDVFDNGDNEDNVSVSTFDYATKTYVDSARPLIIDIVASDAGDGVLTYNANFFYDDLLSAYQAGRNMLAYFQGNVYYLQRYDGSVFEFINFSINVFSNYTVKMFGCMPAGWMAASDTELVSKTYTENYINNTILGGAW